VPPDSVAQLSDAAEATRPVEHPARERHDLGPRIGRHDGEANRLEALRVVDVVPDVGHRAELDSGLTRHVPHHGQLVRDVVHALRAELLGPSSDNRVRLRRHDHVRHADVVEPTQADPVAPPADDRLLTGLAHPDPVVGEDAVEVEDDEPDRAERVTGRWVHEAGAAAERPSDTVSLALSSPTSARRIASSAARARARGFPIRSSSS
jgi:hypothetical protein